MSELSLFQHRGGLLRTRRAIERGTLRVGFVGGSITAETGYTWPEPVVAWLKHTFPDLRLLVENAALGATESALAVFRAQRDLVEKRCDLIFVEFAVNDSGLPREQRFRTREGLIRKLLAGEGSDLVLTYTFCQGMYADMSSGRVPESIADFEELGKHYGIGSVWMGLHALREVQQGLMRWEEWLPDTLHPHLRGSLSYAQSVNAYLQRELVDQPGTALLASGDKILAPYDPAHWESARLIPFEDVALEGPWVIRRSTLWWAKDFLETAAVGAKLSFDFEGRVLALGFNFGKTSSEFRYRLDEGEWQVSQRERPSWLGDTGWYRISVIADDLASGKHHFELEVIHGDGEGCTGSNCLIGFIGVV